MRHCKWLVLLLVGFLLLSACGKPAQDDLAASVSETPGTTDTAAPSSQTDSTGTPTQSATGAAQSAAAAEATTYAYSLPEKTGDMVFTDDPENKFIVAVAEKYRVDTALLAGIYVVPENKDNQVWQFSGKKDANGKLIRNASTLKYVYMLSADCATITRTGGLFGNDGISAPVGFAMFEATKKLIIPEFQAQLDA